MFRPEGVKVLIKPEQVEKVTDGGIILPDTSRDSEQTRVTRGTIAGIGPDASIRFRMDNGDTPNPSEIRYGKIGDKVLFYKYGGISEEKDAYRLVNDEDVIALIE